MHCGKKRPGKAPVKKPVPGEQGQQPKGKANVSPKDNGGPNPTNANT